MKKDVTGNTDLWRNASGIYDPTAGEALTRVNRAEEERNHGAGRTPDRYPLVYICSRYAGDVKANTDAARRYCRYALSMGMNPIAVHLHYTQFLDDSCPAERETGCALGLSLLRRCRELWVFTVDGGISDGMNREISEAVRLGMRIRTFDGRMIE